MYQICDRFLRLAVNILVYNYLSKIISYTTLEFLYQCKSLSYELYTTVEENTEPFGTAILRGVGLENLMISSNFDNIFPIKEMILIIVKKNFSIFLNMKQ